MLVKKLIAAFILTGMAAAYPAENFASTSSTSDLEERATCPNGHNWCCKQALQGFGGQGCYSSNGGKCTKGTSPICCMNGQWVIAL
ncbi:hypothetical protein N7488_005944 [Penicillium malachiteum]|nr:hypothetical protein N7488_005944 [Penicillium malachiteum]